MENLVWKGGIEAALSRQVESRFVVEDNGRAVALFGQGDQNIRLLEEVMRVHIIPRGNELTLRGEQPDVKKAIDVLDDLARLVRSQGYISPQEVLTSVELVKNGEETSLDAIESDVICITPQGKRITPRTLGQKAFSDAMRRSGITFGIGPAGTGKTYLALAHAAAKLKAKEVQRIILTRPAVEAGEKLGFLPGDMQEKVDPYLRPLYDALYDLIGTEGFQKLSERGCIEVAPLAYMRGRTLDDAFVVLDEAQNTTSEQMKMFLTRMGFGSQMVVTGDVTQIDLPRGQVSGLVEVEEVLSGVDGVAFVRLKERDVVRHALVQRIIRAYGRFHNEAGEPNWGVESAPVRALDVS